MEGKKEEWGKNRKEEERAGGWRVEGGVGVFVGIVFVPSTWKVHGQDHGNEFNLKMKENSKMK